MIFFLICNRHVYYPLYDLFWLLTFTCLLVTFQSVTAVAWAGKTSIIVNAKLRASIRVFLTFVDIFKKFTPHRFNMWFIILFLPFCLKPWTINQNKKYFSCFSSCWKSEKSCGVHVYIILNYSFGNWIHCKFPYLRKFSYRSQVGNQVYSYRQNFPQCCCNFGYTRTCSQRTRPHLKKVLSYLVLCI